MTLVAVYMSRLAHAWMLCVLAEDCCRLAWRELSRESRDLSVIHCCRSRPPMLTLYFSGHKNVLAKEDYRAVWR